MGWGSQESRFLFVISTASEHTVVGNLQRGGERRDSGLFRTGTRFGRELQRQEEELDVKEAALCSVSERTE